MKIKHMFMMAGMLAALAMSGASASQYECERTGGRWSSIYHADGSENYEYSSCRCSGGNLTWIDMGTYKSGCKCIDGYERAGGEDSECVRSAAPSVSGANADIINSASDSGAGDVVCEENICRPMTRHEMEAKRQARLQDESADKKIDKERKLNELKAERDAKQARYNELNTEFKRLDGLRVDTNKKLNTAKENHAHFSKIATSKDGKTGMIGFRKSYTAEEQRVAQQQSDEWYTEKERLQSELNRLTNDTNAQKKLRDTAYSEVSRAENAVNVEYCRLNPQMGNCSNS
ncbi:MAG: hypothetical protein FWG39_01555 [Alphaproteobacteria bacterium]|nr:hypothetical protein [Alphaproteobacteria bacterium]